VPDPWAQKPGELLQIQAAERAGVPFLLYRDGNDAQQVLRLEPTAERMTAGRGDACDLRLVWDERVSRTHAVIERVGDEWTVVDDGLSRNGTFVNGIRVVGRRRLSDRDVLRMGHTKMLFRVPSRASEAQTAAASRLTEVETVTSAQRRVLHALARPCVQAQGLVAPASNEQIAADLHLSVEAVKAHLRMLFRRFGIEELPQVQKRLRLVQLAMEAGFVGDRGPEGDRERPSS
jgi:pSer/pThr/pTyr-binding forkhead associated (FHA) protein